MRIVDFIEFCALPDPVYFSQIGTGGVYRRGDIIRNGNKPSDFFQTTIIPPTSGIDLEPIGTIRRCGEFRWGGPDDRGGSDDRDQFCIFDIKDLTAIITVVTRQK